MRKILTLLLTMLLILNACTFFQSDDTSSITGEIIEIPPEGEVVIDVEEMEEDSMEEHMDEDPMEETHDHSNILVRVEGVEGELMTLKPDAFDPDGDQIEYKFTAPFDEDGEWQTDEGDAGEYVVTVTATDGRLSTSEDVLVVITPTNRAPLIICEDEVFVDEGGLVELDCEIEDPEGEPVSATYSGWMTTDEKLTDFDDAGTYEVTITASDGERTRQKTITVNVQDVNRPPVVGEVAKIVVEETDLISVEVEATDEDGDRLTFKFSDQLDDDGQWQTKYGDAGTYDAFAMVSDGKATVRAEFEIVITLKNTAPNLDFIPSIMVDEGETITLPINAYDREGDDLEITISGFFEEETYTTTFEDAGTHEVTITVSDGELTTSQDIEVVVNDVNRPPVFKIPA